MARTKTQSDEDTEQKASCIPTFRSIEEEAEFWDTHDLTEFEDEIEWVTDVTFGSVLSKDELVLRLTDDDLTALVERAQELDTNPGALARRWIQEKLGANPPGDDQDKRPRSR